MSNIKTDFYCQECNLYYSSKMSLHNHKRLSTIHQIKAGLIEPIIKIKKTHSEYVKKYQSKNKEKIREYHKQYYLKNKDKFIDRKIKYCKICEKNVSKKAFKIHTESKKHKKYLMNKNSETTKNND
jgi:hypothetical protein